MPLNSLFKSYNYRKIRFIKFLKDNSVAQETRKSENKEEEVDNKQVNLKSDSLVYSNFLKKTLKYDRELLHFRLKCLLEKKDDLPGLNENFDENIKQYIDIIEQIEQPIIKGDVSYDTAVSF